MILLADFEKSLNQIHICQLSNLYFKILKIKIRILTEALQLRVS